MILSLIGLIAVIATLYVNFTTDLLVYPAQLVLLGSGRGNRAGRNSF